MQNNRVFAGTAAYYRQYRLQYPDTLFAFLKSHLQLTSQNKILDLGCGTGQIAIPLAKLGLKLVAIDPDSDMLSEGRNAEKEHGCLDISWMEGSDNT